ncbi:dpm2 [Blepharisma stoltei]|uniref:Dolichol phosphate-mannose biosynthesis regulatory protein n=1 Tax=Blepharisma stoltei TaxID=1481888 RepID=A0AAU9J745_9CILI|nr:unnamed protein product [Blepharisma stoltei]
MSSKAFGGALMLAGITIFVYYTFWLVVTPYLDTQSFIHNFYPPREWAMQGPKFLLIFGVVTLSGLIGYLFMSTRKPKQA